MSWLLDGRPLRRVLITRLRYLGDVAMSTVLLAALRRGDPALQLDYLCEAAYAPLLDGHPLLANVHALAVRRTGRDAQARRPVGQGLQPGASAGTLGSVARLRRARYDLAVDLLFNPRSAWLLRMAGVPARIGGEPRGYRRRLYTHLVPSPSVADAPQLFARAQGGLGEHLARLQPLRHADGRRFVDWFVDTFQPGDLAPQVARPPLSPPVQALLAGAGVGPGGFTLLAPTATWPTKAWPQRHWLDLAGKLRGDGHAVVVLGAPGATAAGHPLAAAGVAVLPGLPLREALGVVAAARLLVSVDGGIMHAGVAMGVATVALFGPTDPALWFPYETLGPYRVLATRPTCHPCHRHDCDAFVCLPDLSPAAVHGAVRRLLAGGPVT